MELQTTQAVCQAKSLKTGKQSLRHWSNLKPILEGIMAANKNQLPPEKKLLASGQGDVVGGIRRNGGFVKVKELLGAPQKRRLGENSLSAGDNLDRELKRLIKKHGTIPSRDWLRGHKKGAVDAAIREKYGNYTNARKAYGVSNLRKIGSESLSKWPNLRTRIKEILAREDVKLLFPKSLPTAKWLGDNGYCDVREAITQLPGKTEFVCEELGLSQRMLRGDNSLWKWPPFAREIQKHMDANNGVLESKFWFEQHGRYDIATAIVKHGGMAIVRKKMGAKEPQSVIDRAPLDWKGLEKRLREIMLMDGNNGRLPNREWLVAHGMGGMAARIKKEGGFFVVGERLGPAEKRSACLGMYREWAGLKKALVNVIEKEGKLPSWEWFEDRRFSAKYSGIVESVYAHHGDFWRVRQRLEAEGALEAPMKRMKECA